MGCAGTRSLFSGDEALRKPRAHFEAEEYDEVIALLSESKIPELPGRLLSMIRRLPRSTLFLYATLFRSVINTVIVGGSIAISPVMSCRDLAGLTSMAREACLMPGIHVTQLSTITELKSSRPCHPHPVDFD